MNIILIVVDALRAQNLGVYGAEPSPTPNIDAWAKKSVIFENAYTTITKTDASRTAIASGLYPLSSGLIHQAHEVTPQEEKGVETITFLPEILQKKGWRTMAVDWIARWHQRGFDDYSGRLLSDQKRRESQLIKIARKGLSLVRAMDTLALRIFKRDFLMRAYYCFAKNPYICATADEVVQKGIDLIKAKQQKKFFLQLHLWDTHYPHVRPKGFKSYFFDSLESRYNTELSFVDQQLGKLFDYLEEKKHLKDTLVILTADHGESLTEHGVVWAHHNLYEPVVKIPLLINHPKLTAKRINALVQSVDLTPTILELTKIKPPYKLDGISLLPLLKKMTGKVRHWAYFEDLDPGSETLKKPSRKRGLRQGKYKYIQTFRGKYRDIFSLYPPEKLLVKEEIYDLSKDPLETNNLALEKPKLKSSLKNLLTEIIDQLREKTKTRKSPSKPKKKAGPPTQSAREKKVIMERLKNLGYL